jgi:ubiquinone/menaquinone biosynthesis C-methylase UbiE
MSEMDNSNFDPTNLNDPANFDPIYEKRLGKTNFQIWREAYGSDYPEEIEPHSFITKTDLKRIVHWLGIGPGDVLVDLGCGGGGPGLWFARETGANLVGVDFSSTAIEQANQRIADFGLVGRARFQVGNLCETGLPERSCDGAISIDVLMFMPEIAAAMKEISRILRPGARFVFTAFEGRDAEIYRLPLLNNGFDVEIYEEKPNWRSRQVVLYERTVAEQAAIIEELGDGGRALIDEAKFFLADGLVNTRHVIVVGKRASKNLDKPPAT